MIGNLPVKDKAYAAAMLDGEGYVYANRIARARDSTMQTMYQVGIVQDDTRLLEWLENKFGGKIYHRNGKVDRWQCTNQLDIYNFLTVVRPYMMLKCDVADLMIEYCESRMSNEAHTPLSDRELECITKIKYLNETRYSND